MFARPKHMSNGLNLLYPRKDVAEMVIVFCVSPIVPEGLVLVEMKWASDWKEGVAETAEQAAAEEKNSGSNEKGIVSYQQGSHSSALSAGMCL